jgi:hypothetical protein
LTSSSWTIKPWFLTEGKTCCYIHQTLLLGFPAGRSFISSTNEIKFSSTFNITPSTTDLELIRRRQELAHSYVDYAQTEVFVQDIREPEKDADAEDAEGFDSSQDEEEAKDGGNAGTDAPAYRSAPAGGDASIPSAGSDTPDADVSNDTAPSASGSASAPIS